MSDIYPLFHVPFVDEHGMVSKAWMPFIRELSLTLTQIKNSGSGDLVAITGAGDLISSALTKDVANIFSAYGDAGGIEADSDWTALTWDTISNEDSDFKLQTNGDIVCLFTGTVKITYHSTLICSSYVDQTVVEQKIQIGRIDYVDVGGTLDECLFKGSSERGKLTGKKSYNVNEFDIIRAVFSRTSGSSTVETVAEACNITVERLK